MFGIDPPLLSLLSFSLLNFSTQLHPLSLPPSLSSQSTSINSFINAVRIDSFRERWRLGRQADRQEQGESGGSETTKAHRARPENPFQPKANFFPIPIPGLSVLPFLATLFSSSSLECRTQSTEVLGALATGWPYIFAIVLSRTTGSKIWLTCRWMAL